MIRDEFNKQVKTSKYSAKELEGINKMGERTYLALRINKMANNVKGLNWSTVFCAFTVLLAVVLILFVVLSGNAKADFSFIATVSIVGVLAVWCLGWWLIFAPKTKRKIKKYKERIEEIKIEELKRKNH